MNSAVDHRPPKKGKIDDWRREATSTWQRIVADCKVLKEEIRASKDEISEIRDIARTQTNKQMTGYKGISDWAKDALDAHNESIRALSAVSVLGAGLSYTSIVSATRGNISYMCCSFVLFMICLMFATAVQVVLTWCSHRANYPFPNPHLWEIIVAIGVYGAGASMAVAIIFLLVSVQLLSPNPSAPPVVTFSPKASAYVTYALLGSIFIIVLLAFSTFASANGFKFLIWRRSEERLATKAKRLEDFV
ncbi:uncharacterized protein EI90DRAFT_2379709 [Cantharellus anzutake]|uniref:uncharacterized protein n=1 Tax=Cantharellus anzutake TaxID=1750568 RepID=UPI0019046D8B|nr:uncharacterized protein EI90DRAFT_2379709 [Cantharellus anzutake]KAF8323473.1 hypothetical protein EI90DRAFT_2379709 [Cantharellus anzutake]